MFFTIHKVSAFQTQLPVFYHLACSIFPRWTRLAGESGINKSSMNRRGCKNTFYFNVKVSILFIVSVHCREEGCIGKYILRGPRDFTRTGILQHEAEKIAQRQSWETTTSSKDTLAYWGCVPRRLVFAQGQRCIMSQSVNHRYGRYICVNFLEVWGKMGHFVGGNFTPDTCTFNTNTKRVWNIWRSGGKLSESYIHENKSVAIYPFLGVGRWAGRYFLVWLCLDS